MPAQDFDLRALYDAIDARRRERGRSWKEVAAEVNRLRTKLHPIAVSTITGLRQKPLGEGDGILKILIWLRRTPESFVPAMIDPMSESFLRPQLAGQRILRWDVKALYASLESKRRRFSLSWQEVAREVGGVTPQMLTCLARGSRIAFPRAMRLVRLAGTTGGLLYADE